MAKIEPAVVQLTYAVVDGTQYIDLAKDLSKVNRRLYRQGMTYVVQDVQIGVSGGMKATDITQMTISTSGNSWIVHNAWKKGFAAWRNQVNDVDDIGVRPGRWNDFKVYLDDSMEDGTTLEPLAGDAAVYEAGEWNYSKLAFDDDGTEREFKMHLIGSSNLADTNEESGIGLINEYENSRITIGANQEPTIPSDASDTIYSKLLAPGMTDELTDMIVDNVESDNDKPPYDDVNYPGGASNADAAVPVRILSANATQSTAHVPGFIAPCGLLKITANEMQLDGSALYEQSTATTTLLILTLAVGPYRGVMAAPMGQ